jgi:DNA-binding MarR family transcriptional regulator
MSFVLKRAHLSAVSFGRIFFEHAEDRDLRVMTPARYDLLALVYGDTSNHVQEKRAQAVRDQEAARIARRDWRWWPPPETPEEIANRHKKKKRKRRRKGVTSEGKTEGRGVMLQSRIREVLGVSGATVSKMLKRLRALCLVEVKPLPRDRRRKVVSLTGWGLELLKKAFAVVRGKRVLLNRYERAIEVLDGVKRRHLVSKKMSERIDHLHALAKRLGCQAQWKSDLKANPTPFWEPGRTQCKTRHERKWDLETPIPVEILRMIEDERAVILDNARKGFSQDRAVLWMFCRNYWNYLPHIHFADEIPWLEDYWWL